MWKSAKDNGQQDSQAINIKRIKVKLVFIGLLYLIGFTFAGIIIVQFIGWGIEELIGLVHAERENFSMGNYVSDLLGGAIGLSIGLALDKICIEKYNNVNHYKALMRVVIQELDGIKKTPEDYDEDLKKKKINIIKEYIFDDVVMTAETISVIANIPFAKKQVKELISIFTKVQKNIESYNRKINELIKVTEVLAKEEKIDLVLAIKQEMDKTTEQKIDKTTEQEMDKTTEQEMDKTTKQEIDKTTEQEMDKTTDNSTAIASKVLEKVQIKKIANELAEDDVNRLIAVKRLINILDARRAFGNELLQDIEKAKSIIGDVSYESTKAKDAAQ